MAKVTLNDIGTLANPASARQAINEQLQKIEDEFQKVVYRDGSTPNSMEADLDMDSHRVLNVADAVHDKDAVNKGQVEDIAYEAAEVLWQPRYDALVNHVEDELSRSLKLPSGFTNMSLPAPEPARILGWNSTGDALQNTDAGQWQQDMLNIQERELPLVSAVEADQLRVVRGGQSVRVPIMSLPVSAAVQEQLDTLADGQGAGQLVYRTWSELSGVTGSVGEGAQVIDDTGTHTDPVTSATVPNQGQYVWSNSPAGWRWVREDAIAEMAPEVRRLGDSVHEATWPGVMTAMVGADGRRTWLEADDENGYPTEWSKEVLARALGYRMKYTPGLMFAVHDESGRLTELCARESDGKFPDFVVESLAKRLPAYIDVGGRPKTAHNNIAALRKTRMKLAKLRAGDANTQLDLCFIGDSYTAGHLYYLNKLTAALAKEYGFAGPGFIGFNHGAALGDTNFQYTRTSTTYFGGDWTVSNLGTASPDNRTVTGAAGAYIVINAIETSGISTAVTTARLLYLGNGASHVVRYRWGDELPWNELTLTGTGAAAVDFPVLPGGTGWKFRLEVVSGNPTLFGVWLGNSANGVRVSKLAASGSASGDWYKPNDATWMAQWKASVSLIPADAYFIMLGGNDQSSGVSPATYLANMQGIVSMLQEINPSADIHLCVRQDTNRASSVPMASYAKALGDWAWDNMIPFSDMQYAFGPDPDDYAHDGPLPLIGEDQTHPTTTTGGRLITEFFRRLINAAQ